ncbi:MAG TPA: CaiB/BaiF CoA-transferase family protein [Candidatus Acidoferrales bacterium]|jgi:itaconate CoA-transferase|nr:CaiB/BaiF CoA-transferase family protein [Candidatus Acidoferrales bacterium]
MLPLAGITVVSLEQAVAAPFATRQLADLGARVIKIERPDGGDFARGYDGAVRGLSSHFVWLNRSKESLTLDLKRTEAKVVLDRLLEDADIFVQNLAPGATERLGFVTKELRKKYPRLIICNLSGYGSSGPYRDKKAYDMLIQAESGLISITGTEETPCKTGISAADVACGMYAYSGILTALLMRSKTGEGVALQTSLFDSLGEWMSAAAYYTFGGSAPQRTGANHATIAPYGPVTSGDNKVVYLGLQNEREWKKFCEVVLESSQLSTDPRFDSNAKRVQNRRQLDRVMREVFQKLTAAEIIARLEAAQIANARQNTVQEFVEHPQLKTRERWSTVGSPVGPLPALLPPVELENVETVMNEVPTLGQHTDSVLSEFGFDAGTIAAWRREKII